MKTYNTILLGLAVLSLSMWCSAATYLMDFSTFQDTGGYVEGTWNTYAAPANVTGTLKDNTGSSAAGITLSYTGNLGGNTHAHYFNNLTGGASWATAADALDKTQAVGDYFSSNNKATPAIFTFGGLKPGDTISLDLLSAYNAENTSARGQYAYSIDNGLTYHGFDIVEKDGSPVSEGAPGSTYFNGNSQGNTKAQYMTIRSLTVGPSGNVRVKIQDNGAYGEFAVISAMQLSVNPIPKSPTYAILILAGMGGLVACRRS
ncbi:hypothetical protein P3T73_00670 [Kiritimatiellota bacterium B12222]|nr:hypothetical protein P3T73_00670 [Kiritimatiellota bacterium B12222]